MPRTARASADGQGDHVINRGNHRLEVTPWGSRPWQQRIAARLGIEASLRRRGRPRKTRKTINRPGQAGGKVECPLCLARFAETSDIGTGGMMDLCRNAPYVAEITFNLCTNYDEITRPISAPGVEVPSR